MNTLLCWAVVLTALSGAAMPAQDVAGTWQGTIPNSRPVRFVLKISMSENKALKVDAYDLDDGAVRTPLLNATFDGHTLRFPLAGHSGSYQGEISPDRNTIIGYWKQEEDSRPVPLTFTRATPSTLWAFPQVDAGLSPMAKDAHPSFEVATIKPAAPGEAPHSLNTLRMQGRHLAADNISLLALIGDAYSLQPRQIIGAPKWADSAYFDIAGVPDTPGRPSGDQALQMYRKLLADRFKLTFHRSTKEFAVYALAQGSHGPILTKSTDPNGPKRNLVRVMKDGSLILTFSNISMPELASQLMHIIPDQQVVDVTCLKDRYDVRLTFSYDPSAADLG